ADNQITTLHAVDDPFHGWAPDRLSGHFGEGPGSDADRKNARAKSSTISLQPAVSRLPANAFALQPEREILCIVPGLEANDIIGGQSPDDRLMHRQCEEHIRWRPGDVHEEADAVLD